MARTKQKPRLVDIRHRNYAVVAGHPFKCPVTREKMLGRLKSVKPKRKYHAATEILRYQSSTELLIPRLPFARLVKDIASKYCSYKFRARAVIALQEAAEDFLVHLLNDANKCAIHAGRITLEPEDIKLAMELRKDEMKFKLNKS